ncbi:F0F1 ATP synthase subunit gamma [Thermaurantiacus sp.]
MPSLKSLKLRIASVKSTQKITKAMNLVATAKLRGCQQAAIAGRPFASRAANVIANLAANMTGPEAPRLIAGTGRDQTRLLIVLTSERGLCGAFNSNMVRLARRRADELLAEGRTVKLYVVGKKGRTLLQRSHGRLIVGTREVDARKVIQFWQAKAIADDILARFEAGEFDVAQLFYAHYQSALAQVPTEEQLIPLPRAAAGARLPAAIEFEPSAEEILADLLPRMVATRLYQAMLESRASEEGARMTAMDSATRNAGEMIGRLTLTYNRTRQAAITKELIEIISGAEAL